MDANVWGLVLLAVLLVVGIVTVVVRTLRRREEA
jgi:hypothetical protein